MWRKHLCFIYFTVWLTAVGGGMHFSWVTSAIFKIVNKLDEIEISEERLSYLPMLPFLGYCVGAPICSVAMDMMGRKKTTLLVAWGQIIGWLLIIFGRSEVELFISRIFVGISLAVMYSVNPAYLSEVADKDVRGLVCSATVVGYYCGMLMNTCYNLVVPLRTSAAISVIVPVVYLGLYHWLPESPFYLMMRDRKEKARESLKYLRMEKYNENELDQIAKTIFLHPERGTLKDLFCISENRNTFALIALADFLEMFSGYAAINIFAYRIFNCAGVPFPIDMAVIVLIFVQMVATFVGSRICDIIGRTKMMIISNLTTTVILLGLAIFFHIKQSGRHETAHLYMIPTCLIVLYFTFFGLGPIPLNSILRGEVFSLKIKAKALSILTVYRSGILAVTSKLLFFIWKVSGPHVGFYLFAAFCASGVPFAIWLLPETKGKSLEQIHQRMHNYSLVHLQRRVSE